MFSRTVTRLATQRVGLLRQSRQSVRRFSEQAKDGSKAAPEAGSGAPPPPPPPPQSGGGGGGLFLLLGAGGAAYYFQDEIKKQLGMEEKQPVPAAAVAATGHPEPTPSDSVKPTVNEPIQEDVPEVVAPVTAPVQSENVAEPSTPTNTAAGPVDWNEVRAAIVDLLDNENYDDGSYGPLLVRLAWHHAGTYDKNTNIGGSEGAGMRFKNESEWGANAGLNVARALLEPVKAQFPQVTYSDLWSFAGTVALEEMGANDMNWRSGRKDLAAGPSPLPDGLLPDADGRDHPKNPADHLRDIFGRMGFNDKEIVCLSGAHALGRCHVDRSGYWGPWTRAPTTLSNEYYRLLLEERWSKKMTHYGREWNGPEQYEDPTGELMMLPTDLALVQDEKMRPYVVEYANNDEAFQRDFAKAWIKLQELGVRRFHGRRRYLLFGPRE